MPVYVDDARLPYGRMIMCHMWADEEDELHAMARWIGVARRWHQAPPQASWSHYDICLSKRRLAVFHGAIETDILGPAEHTARMRGDQMMLNSIATARAHRAATRSEP